MIQPRSAFRAQQGAQQSDIISVTSLNRLARSLLESNFPSVTVEGEISNLATPGSGHWYLSLKDSSAQIRCCMFRNRNSLLRFRPRNGMQVVIRGRLSIYEGRGDFQLIADSMEEAGDGLLRRAFEELKSRLSSQGLFDQDHKQPVGTDFRHIGLVTSPTGAAVRDLVTVFRRRFPAITLTVFPVPVQGSEAPAAIVKAIETANRRRDELRLDALILSRGGGSLEDLQAFNEESVALALYASDLPVVSAVGHEIDFSIADFVADLRAPTPSAAAEMLSPDQQEYRQVLRAYEQQLLSLASRMIAARTERLRWLTRQMKHPGRRLQDHAQSLDRLEARLIRAIRSRLERRQSRLSNLHSVLLLRSPVARIKSLSLERKNLVRRLRQSIQRLLDDRRNTLAQLSRSLDNISPLGTLSRGYSISYDEKNRVLRSTDSLKPGDLLTTRLHNGKLTSTITNIEE